MQTEPVSFGTLAVDGTPVLLRGRYRKNICLGETVYTANKTGIDETGNYQYQTRLGSIAFRPASSYELAEWACRTDDVVTVVRWLSGTSAPWPEPEGQTVFRDIGTFDGFLLRSIFDDFVVMVIGTESYSDIANGPSSMVFFHNKRDFDAGPHGSIKIAEAASFWFGLRDMPAPEPVIAPCVSALRAASYTPVLSERVDALIGWRARLRREEV